MTKNPSAEVGFEVEDPCVSYTISAEVGFEVEDPCVSYTISAPDIDALAEYLRNAYAGDFEARSVAESLIDKLRRCKYYGEEEAYLNITIRPYWNDCASKYWKDRDFSIMYLTRASRYERLKRIPKNQDEDAG